MIEYFDHFLSGDHFFNKTVQLPQTLLLCGIVCFTFLPTEPYIPEHDSIAGSYDQRQPPVQDIKYSQSAHHLDKALDGHGKAVI